MLGSFDEYFTEFGEIFVHYFHFYLWPKSQDFSEKLRKVQKVQKTVENANKAKMAKSVKKCAFA